MKENKPESFRCSIVKIQDGDNFRNNQNKSVIFNSICIHSSHALVIALSSKSAFTHSHSL